MRVLTDEAANQLLSSVGLKIVAGGRLGRAEGPEYLSYAQFPMPENYLERMLLPERVLDWFKPAGRWKILNISNYSFFDVCDAIVINRLVGCDFIGLVGRAQRALLFEWSDDPKKEFQSNVMLAFISAIINNLGQHAQIASDGCEGDIAGFEDGYLQFISAHRARLDLANQLIHSMAALPGSRAAWYRESQAAAW